MCFVYGKRIFNKPYAFRYGLIVNGIALFGENVFDLYGKFFVIGEIRFLGKIPCGIRNKVLWIAGICFISGGVLCKIEIVDGGLFSGSNKITLHGVGHLGQSACFFCRFRNFILNILIKRIGKAFYFGTAFYKFHFYMVNNIYGVGKIDILKVAVL